MKLIRKATAKRRNRRAMLRELRALRLAVEESNRIRLGVDESRSQEAIKMMRALVEGDGQG